MQHIQDGAQSLSLLLKLNLDRFLFLGTLALSLAVGAYVGSH